MGSFMNSYFRCLCSAVMLRPSDCHGLSIPEIDRATEKGLRVVSDVSAVRHQTLFSALFEHAPVGIVIYDRFLTVVDCNEAFAHLMGASRERTVGSSIDDLRAQRHRKAVLRALDGDIDTEEGPFEAEAPARSTWLMAKFVPLKDATGYVGHAMGFVREGASQQDTKDVAQLTDRLTWMLSIAHDFNNLLTVIRANLDLAVAALPRDAPIETELRDALGAVARASGLTRQLLAFGRRQVVQPRAVDLNALLTETRALLRHVLPGDIEVRLTLVPALWAVFGDPNQLEQVMMNLAVNARDAMPKGGRLLISTANVTIHEPLRERPGLRAGEYVLVIVEDTGHGIDPALLERIFEPFVTTKAPGRGTGLGLATVYGIVKQTGGCVYAETVAGGGARFLVFLPRYKEWAAG
jgi:two-component system, cell cycle sensor histidine kinase and response regulator CckA